MEEKDREKAAETATAAVTAKDQPRIADEMRGMAREPLLPIEKKLVLWSVIIGTALLGILVWLSYTFFPAK